jgi:hypothetical protein
MKRYKKNLRKAVQQAHAKIQESSDLTEQIHSIFVQAINSAMTLAGNPSLMSQSKWQKEINTRMC